MAAAVAVCLVVAVSPVDAADFLAVAVAFAPASFVVAVYAFAAFVVVVAGFALQTSCLVHLRQILL